MKLMQSAQCYLSMLGITSNQSLANVNFFIAELIINTHICLDCVFVVCKAKTFREYAYVLFYISTEITTLACFTIFATKRMHLFKVIDISEELVERRSEDPIKRAMYAKTNQTAEKWSKLAFIFMAMVTPVCLILPKAIDVCFTYFTTDLGNDAFEMPFDIWLPFDWKNPIGYAIAVFIQYLFTLYLFLISVGILSAAFVGLLLANAMINDLKSYLIKINENSKFKKNHLHATKELCHFVQIHTLVKQLLYEFLIIIDQMGMIYFTWAVTVVCGVMLLVQNEISRPEIDFVVLIVTISELFDVLLSVCVVCELGQQATDIFSSIIDVIEQFDWYRYPEAMKRMLLIILLIVQKPVEIKCFGSFAANRDSFKTIVRGGFSYFAVLRNFTH